MYLDHQLDGTVGQSMHTAGALHPPQMQHGVVQLAKGLQVAWRVVLKLATWHRLIADGLE